MSKYKIKENQNQIVPDIKMEDIYSRIKDDIEHLDAFNKAMYDFNMLYAENITKEYVKVSDFWVELTENKKEIYSMPFITYALTGLNSSETGANKIIEDFLYRDKSAGDDVMLSLLAIALEANAYEYLDEDSLGYALATFNISTENEHAWLYYTNFLITDRLPNYKKLRNVTIGSILLDMGKIFANIIVDTLPKDVITAESIDKAFEVIKKDRVIEFDSFLGVGRYVTLKAFQSFIRKFKERSKLEIPFLLDYFAHNINVDVCLSDDESVLYGLNAVLKERCKSFNFANLIDDYPLFTDFEEILDVYEEDGTLDLRDISYVTAEALGTKCSYIVDMIDYDIIDNEGYQIVMSKKHFSILHLVARNSTTRKAVQFCDTKEAVKGMGTIAFCNLLRELGLDYRGYMCDTVKLKDDMRKEKAELMKNVSKIEKERNDARKELKKQKQTITILESKLKEKPKESKQKKKNGSNNDIRLLQLETELKDVKQKLHDATQGMTLEGTYYTKESLELLVDKASKAGNFKEIHINGRTFTKADIEQIVEWYSNIVSLDGVSYEEKDIDEIIEEIKGVSVVVYGGEANIIQRQLNNVGLSSVVSTFNINEVYDITAECVIYAGEPIYDSIIKELESKGRTVIVSNTTNPVLLCRELYSRIKVG